MTCTCRKVLKLMKKLTNGSDIEMFWSPYDLSIYLADQCNSEHRIDCSKYENDMHVIIAKLFEEKCLREGRTPYYFYLTYDGLHPWAITWEKAKNFILRSICVPIIVAFITAWLTATFLS